MSTTTTSHSAHSTSPCEGLRTHAHLDNRLVQDIVAYLSANNGPDDQGRAHHKKVRLPIAEVEAAIDILNAQGELLWLRPYHISPAPTGSWHEQRLVGREISVSMTGIRQEFRGSPYAIVQHYLQLVGRADEYAWLKPYHMSMASLGTWKDPKVVDEILKSKCDALRKEKFGGDLIRFCCEVTKDDLLQPLKETHAGRDILISMGVVGSSCSNSPYAMTLRYLQILGLEEEFAWFKPYHMSVASSGTWQQQEYQDEILVRKCEAVLGEMYGNDLVRFCCEVTQNDLLSPLIEIHGGREIAVSMSILGQRFLRSPYAMVKEYLRITGRTDEFSWLKPYHMTMAPLGTWQDRATVDEALRKKCDAVVLQKFGGDLSVADLRKIKRSDGTYDTGQYGFKNFTAGDKTAIREFMLEAIEDVLKDRAVHYLGLETEQFISLRALYERVNLSPRNSLVVERDPRIFAAMKTTAQMLPSRERRSLGAINLAYNTLEGALAAAKRGSFQFNVVNLDYLGHMSTEKELTLQLLLEKNLLDTESLVFITLQDTELARSRAHKAGYGDDQAQALDREIHRLAHLTGHSALRLAMLHYNGGSGGKVGSQMLWVAYSIKRNTPP